MNDDNFVSPDDLFLKSFLNRGWDKLSNIFKLKEIDTISLGIEVNNLNDMTLSFLCFCVGVSNSMGVTLRRRVSCDDEDINVISIQAMTDRL